MASLEYNCEAVIMQLLAPLQATGEPLYGLEFRHHETAGASALETIIFKAVVGEKLLECTQPYRVAVSIEYGSQTDTPEQADGVARAMVDAVYRQYAWPAIDPLELGPGAWIEPECQTERIDNAKTRVRRVTIPIFAQLSLDEPGALYYRPGGLFLFHRPDGSSLFFRP